MADIERIFADGVAHHRAGRLAEAAAVYEQVLAAAPAHAPALHALGVIRHQQGRHGDASALIGRAVEIRPDYPEARYNLGLALFAEQRLSDAISQWTQVAAARPNLAAVFANLGAAHLALADHVNAEENCRRALALDPEIAEAHSTLGRSFLARDRLIDAEASLALAARLRPDDAGPLMAYGIVLGQLGRHDESIAVFERVLALTPAHAAARSNILLAMQYRPVVSAVSLRAAHEIWERDFGARLRGEWRPHANTRDPGRPLRIGLLSPDLNRHPVGFFMLGLIQAAGRNALMPICYGDGGRRDDVSARLGEIIEVGALDDEALATRIRVDRIDVLVDLAGHTARNRLQVFARKPAPLQVTWAGYVGTTGLAAMDGLIADRHHVPESEDAAYVERVLRLEGGYVAWLPPPEAPPVAPAPFIKNGVVTFGCFNNPAKINAPLLDLWARILQAVPNARLLLKYRGMPDNRTRIIDALASRGIDPARVTIEGSGTALAMLARYHAVDIALDTQPYSGGLTTLEALWMGAPVVTFPGATFAGRHSTSYLRHAGLDDLVARDADDYVARAAALARDSARLASRRGTLRAQLQSSSLCDANRLTRALEAALRRLWRDWCNRAD